MEDEDVIDKVVFFGFWVFFVARDRFNKEMNYMCCKYLLNKVHLALVFELCLMVHLF